ncbi:MAG: FtsQ-type POTRA domain-containing protein [bacterium]|nr:FtsQ-type POTRA domain-containing protein [bacterium]
MAKKIRKQGTRVRHTTRKVSTAKGSAGVSIFDRLGGGIVPIVLSVAILACLGIVFLLTYETIGASNFFRLRNVNVSGTDRASASDIEKIVTANAEKPGVWNADLLAIKQKIENVTFVKTAAVSRSLPSGLNVTVTERVPVAIVRLGGGDFLADAEGVILAPAKAEEKQIPFAMVGWSEEKSDKAAKENSERLKMYQKMLTEWKDYDLAKRVKQVDITDLREPKATLEDSGMPVTIMLSRDNFGKHLADGIKAVVGKGTMFEGVNLVGQNLVLVPRK